MPQAHRAERALRVLAHTSRQQYVCRSCRAQQIRRLHSSPTLHAPRTEKPFLERLKENIFGSSKVDEAAEAESRERTKELARKHDFSKPLETRRAADGKRDYAVAAVYDPTVNQQYAPATTWDDLEVVGSKQWVKDRKDRGEMYSGYLPRYRPALRNDEWLNLLHNVAVEVLLLQKAGRDVDQIWYPRGRGQITFDQTRTIEIKPTEDGGHLVSHKAENAEVKILQNIPEQHDESADQSWVRAGHGGLQSGFGNADDAWTQIRFMDAKTRLAISKRITQLTGRRVPDPVISNATTMAEWFNALKLKDRPKKLAKTDELRRLNIELPNVTVYTNRQTIVHKERKVGRWKLIESELEARDLPVLGNRWPQAKNMIEPKPSRLQRRLNRSPASMVEK